MAKRKEKPTLVDMMGDNLDKRRAREVNYIGKNLGGERPIVLPLSDVIYCYLKLKLQTVCEITTKQLNS